VAVLKLWFERGSRIELVRSEFQRTGQEVLVSTRGRLASPNARGNFQWSRAVQALAELLLRFKIHSQSGSEHTAELIGTKGSSAASLDYALGKGPSWLVEMFGCDSKGALIARRYFRRINTEMKRAGPVSIHVNSNLLSNSDIHIYLDGCVCQNSTLISILESISGTTAINSSVANSFELIEKDSHLWFPSVINRSQGSIAVTEGEITDRILHTMLAEQSLTIIQLRSILRDRLKIRADEKYLSIVADRIVAAGFARKTGDCYLASSFLSEQISKLVKVLNANSNIASSLGKLKKVSECSYGATYEFYSLMEGDRFLSLLHKEFALLPIREKSIMWHLGTAWWPLAHPWPAVAGAHDKDNKAKISYIVPGTSSIDKWAAGFYKQQGITGFTGIETDYDFDFWIGGDIIVWITSCTELESEIRQYISKFKDIGSFDDVALRKNYLEHPTKSRLHIAALPFTAKEVGKQFAGYCTAA